MYNGSDSNTSEHTRIAKPLETRRTSHEGLFHQLSDLYKAPDTVSLVSAHTTTVYNHFSAPTLLCWQEHSSPCGVDAC